MSPTTFVPGARNRGFLVVLATLTLIASGCEPDKYTGEQLKTFEDGNSDGTSTVSDTASSSSGATDAKHPVAQDPEVACSKYDASHSMPALLHAVVHVSEPPVPLVQVTLPQSATLSD